MIKIDILIYIVMCYKLYLLQFEASKNIAVDYKSDKIYNRNHHEI
jgi:hypothetical protein